ncbi:MAG: hypothetical protein N4A68_19600 [Maledivibacter sp.]|jgi:hypothetical protein|nr:hypothetical protein [Maledivibacter sp.]
MKDFRSLKLLDRFSFIFEKMGIDYKVMRRILQLKFIMDGRRVPTIMTNQKKDKKENNFFIKSLLSYGLVGLLVMAMVISSLSLFVKMSFAFGISIFMIMTTMISDFSTVLLDVKDKNILLSKPIDAKTVNAAKIVHIFIYLFIITMVIAGPSLIAGTIKHGFIFFLVFFLDMILISAFIIFLTSSLYCIILNFFDGEKLKDIINYVQIILSITLLIGYQFIGRMFDVFSLDLVFTPKWWIYLIPPAWFAAPFEMLINGDYGSHFIYLGIISILVPIISLIIHIKIVIPYFEKNLVKLNNNSGRTGVLTGIKERIRRQSTRILCSDRMENIFFRFTQDMISNERKFKLRIYPNLAFAAVMPMIMVLRTFRGDRSFSESILEIANGKSYMSIYFSVLLLANLITMIGSSEKYKGGWIYKVLPIENPSPIYKGSFKGFLIKYVVPIYLIPSLVFLVIYKFKIITDIVLMLLNMILLCLLILKKSSKDLPFCKDINYIQENNAGTFFLTAGFCGVSLGLQWALKSIKFGLPIYCVVVALIIIFLWKKSFNISWEDII